MKKRGVHSVVMTLAMVMMFFASLGSLEIVLRVFPDINRRNFYKVSWNHWKVGDDLKKSKEASDSYTQRYVYDADIGYVKKDFIENANVLGDSNSPKNFNILILGDSVSDTGTYVDKLKTMVDKDYAPSVDIINAGVVGYDTKMEYEFLKKYGLSSEPDLVVLQFNVNDFHGTPLIMKQQDSTWVAYDQEFAGVSVSQSLFERSELYKLYITTLMRYRRKSVSPIATVKPFLDKTNTLLKSKDTEFFVVFFPLFSDKKERDKLHTHFLNIAHELRLDNSVIDLTPVFDAYTNEQISIDAWHPNAQGDQIAAEETYTYIKPLIEKSKEATP